MRKKATAIVPIWGGRDDNKVFVLTEMPAAQAEKWAIRLFLAFKGTTAEVPPEVQALGMAGVTIRMLNSMLTADVKYDDIEPLLDEMFQCISIIRDPHNHPDVALPLIESDTEEVLTRAWLRSEVIRLHTNFSPQDGFWALLALMQGREVSSIM